MPYDNHPFFVMPKDFTDLAGGLRLTTPCPDSANRHDGLFGTEHRVCGSDKNEIRAFSHGKGGLVHDFNVGNVTVGKCHQIYLMLSDELSEMFFGVNGYSLGVEFARY
jgi:hypothetical protein